MTCCLFVCCCAVLCRADDEADRQALVRQQNKVAALEAQLATLKVGLGSPGFQSTQQSIAVRTASITLVVTRSGVGAQLLLTLCACGCNPAGPAAGGGHLRACWSAQAQQSTRQQTA